MVGDHLNGFSENSVYVKNCSGIDYSDDDIVEGVEEYTLLKENGCFNFNKQKYSDGIICN